jgi:MOSC domain-containing protein YiiM
MTNVKHLTLEELEAGLGKIRRSPKDEGVLQMIVRRPLTDKREVLEVGELDPEEGLAGDNWLARRKFGSEDEAPPIDTQITMMNARLIALLAQEKERWPLAGDQLYIDLDLSTSNLTPGTQLALGTAVIEITAELHTGCDKFAARYGPAATRLVNSAAGKELRLRGIYAKVVQSGVIRVGDVAKKIQVT